MTMKEIEQESGMTRANIRYYEAEGLLTPARGANGYRDYSDEDLEVLKKIKLFRSLHFSLEEIKDLQTGRRNLPEALGRQLIKLQQEKTQIEHSQELCRVMLDEGARYQTLDAQRYLAILEQGGTPVVPQQDVLPEVRVPWRRFFARNMDLVFYTAAVDVFLALVLGVNVIGTRREGWGALYDIAALLLMLLTEPAMLALFGTTPGKWILGLGVTDNEGRRLTFGEARERTWKMFLHGMGLYIPGWNLFRLWKSYKACVEGETQEWEYHSAVTLKDERGWRTAAYIGACVFLGAGVFLAFKVSALPKNRGDITVAEFSENYNLLSGFYGYGTDERLDREGKWIHDRSREGVVTIVVGGHDRPAFQFSETDGIVTGVSFSVVSQGEDEWVTGYQEEMILSMLAFAGARKENSVFSREMEEAVNAVQGVFFESFEFSVCGVKVNCETTYSGYTAVPGVGVLIPEKGKEGQYSVSFSMVK